MQSFHGVFQDTAGDAVSSANVYVYDAGTTDIATIYEDNGVTEEDNPFTTDAYGEYVFWAANGRYDVKLTKTGYDTKYIYDISLFDKAIGDGGTIGNNALLTFDNTNSDLKISYKTSLKTSDGDLVKRIVKHITVATASPTAIGTFVVDSSAHAAVIIKVFAAGMGGGNQPKHAWVIYKARLSANTINDNTALENTANELTFSLTAKGSDNEYYINLQSTDEDAYIMADIEVIGSGYPGATYAGITSLI